MSNEDRRGVDLPSDWPARLIGLGLVVAGNLAFLVAYRRLDEGGAEGLAPAGVALALLAALLLVLPFMALGVYLLVEGLPDFEREAKRAALERLLANVDAAMANDSAAVDLTDATGSGWDRMALRDVLLPELRRRGFKGALWWSRMTLVVHQETLAACPCCGADLPGGGGDPAVCPGCRAEVLRSATGHGRPGDEFTA